MRDTSLFRKLLSFPGLSVRKVEVSEDGSLLVRVAVRGKPRCAGCEKKRPGYDKTRGSRWRHLDVLDRRCYLVAQLRRTKCRQCGILVERVPWADPRCGFTHPFEDQVGWLAQHCDKTTVSEFVGIAWRTVGTILTRLVGRRRNPVDLGCLRKISVDELSYRKGHRYLTLVTDLEKGRIVWGAEGRSAATLGEFFASLPPEVRAQIELVAIDMSAGYEKAVRLHLPNAAIVFDRFHVQALVGRAVDETRRDLWRELQATAEGKAVKQSRYALLKSPWLLTPSQTQALAAVKRDNEPLYRAYLLKEAFFNVFRYAQTRGFARKEIQAWLKWASRSRLQPFVKAGRTIRSRLEPILRYFSTRCTTSASEGLNTKARLATRQAYGFHSAYGVLAMIELRCTGLRIPLPRRF